MRAIAEVLERHLLEHMIRAVRVEQITGENRVEVQATKSNARTCQHERDDFEVMAAFGNRFVFEQRLQRAQHEVCVELRWRGGTGQQVVSLAIAPMTDWNVSPLAVVRGHSKADDRRAHRRGLIGDQVDREAPR